MSNKNIFIVIVIVIECSFFNYNCINMDFESVNKDLFIYIIGALYKPPNVSIDIFNSNIETILKLIQKEKKSYWRLQH